MVDTTELMMRRFAASLLFSLFVLVVTNACRTDKNRFNAASELAPAEDTTPNFRIFDQAYNFVTYYSLSDPKYAQDNFKVYRDEASQIANLDPKELYTARFQLLESATKSVHIQVLTYWADETGWRMTDKLIELKKKGLDVKVTVDGITNLSVATQKMLFNLQQNGIEVAGFEPFFLFTLEEIGPLDNLLSRVSKLNARFHEKIFLIDSEDPVRARAIIGGANLSNHYFRVDTEHPEHMWTDQDVMLRGPVVETLTKTFDENFKTFQDHKVLRSFFNPERLWAWAQERAKKAGKETLINIEKPEFNPAIIAELKRMEKAELNLTWHQAVMRPIGHRPRMDQFYIGDAFLTMLADARSEVKIANSFFVPDDRIIEGIAEAARRGVRVKILTNSLQSVQFQPMGLASRSRYAKLLEVNKETLAGNGGVEIYEWQGKDQTPDGQGLFHAKYAVFDGEAAMVGSYNLDPRSTNFDSENIVAVLEKSFSSGLGERFDSQVSPEFSKPISASQAEAFNQTDGMVDTFKKNLALKLTPYL